MRIEEQLRELFSLSLQIKGCHFDHNPQSEWIHLHKFTDKKQSPHIYEVDIQGYYGDWVLDSHKNSLVNSIKNAKELIKLQNS